MKQRGHRSERARARIEFCHTKRGGGFRRKKNCEFLGSADISTRGDDSGGYPLHSRSLVRNKHIRHHGDPDFPGISHESV